MAIRKKLAVPTALMEPYDFVARSLVPTRAYENQVFLAYANRCGREGELLYHGLSCIVGPDGTDLARAGTEEELLLADLHPALLAASRPHNTTSTASSLRIVAPSTLAVPCASRLG